MSDFTKVLSAENIQVPLVYREVFLNNYKYFVLSSGRAAGKTSILVNLWWITHSQFPDRDIVMLQATAAEIKDSIINEIKKFINASGLEDEFQITGQGKGTARIERVGRKGITYFYPITDSKGGMRTRGIATENKIALVMYEECQKNKDANVVEQSLITFMRQLGDDQQAKIVIVGNNETAGHWFVDYVNDKKQNPAWHYIHATYKDIENLLNKEMIDHIKNLEKVNNAEYRRVYLGDINANTSDVVFPQFVRAKHYKRAYELEKRFIRTIFVGIDHATANDTFAVVPVCVLDDGTAQTIEILYNDPEETLRSLAPTEQCSLLENFMEHLDEKYGLVDNQVDIYLSVDGAASPFIAQLKHLKQTSKNKNLWKRIQIKGFNMKKKDINLGTIRNMFAYDVLTILNEGGTLYDGRPNRHRLVTEIEKQRFKNKKLDASIKNDLVDALEYGLIPYVSNCYNVSYPIRVSESVRKKLMDIRKLAGVRAA